MAAKLKSIIRQIRWSLLLKAAAFAVAWFYFPFWVFLAVAFYCYIVPPFRSGKFAVPFIVLMLLSAFQSQSVLMALVFGAIFYYLLLTKELLLIDRAMARLFLTMALSFLLFREFYFGFTSGPISFALGGAFVVAALFAFLVHNLIGNLRRSYENSIEKEEEMRTIVSWVSFLIMAQCLIVALFLPLNFIYQSLLVFLPAVLFIDLVPSCIFKTLSWEKIRLTATVIFALFAIVLVSARWGF